MPCYDPETHERPIRLEARVHELTAMLCEVCGQLETYAPNAAQAFSPKTANWWEKHKAVDAEIERIKKKKAEFGDESLTPKERGMLWCGPDVSWPPMEPPSVNIIR